MSPGLIRSQDLSCARIEISSLCLQDRSGSGSEREREIADSGLIEVETVKKMGRSFFRPAAVVFNINLWVCVLLFLYCSHVGAVESEGSAAASEATVAGLSFRTSRRTSIQSAADILHIVSGLYKFDRSFRDSSCLLPKYYCRFCTNCK